MLLLNERTIGILACPLDQTELRVSDGGLACNSGHQFASENGIPVLTGAVRRESVPTNMEPTQRSLDEKVDYFVNDWLVNTNGNLYWRARGRLQRYPIPTWPLGRSKGQTLVDIGCGWGRWSIAAARAGFSPIG